ELDRGTTTIRSSEEPAVSRSAETTTAGRFLPGSPRRASRSETSHTSPLRGSVDAIFERGLPDPQLLDGHWILRVESSGLALGLPERLALSFVGDLGKQSCQRHSPFARLLGQEVTRVPRYANRRRSTRHGHSLAPPTAPSSGAMDITDCVPRPP